ncbi:pyridoxamine 5'-phosphate oxidase family protein [Geotalea sp. SG265]|uniref:pyridoxamine 5'-phosphate oxidase family protein n=1 Tax=Geotalea sp. SG265 TaxID=2922867 RepID=UPI001FB005AF|nr:pyridoxamine 5'-phosphate oxidase family protein [Geotalea sp. SG265]
MGILTDEMQRFIEATGHAFVASSDATGYPHLAAGRDLHVRDDSHLIFEAWFCHTTMENVTANPKVAVAVTAPAADRGYQFGGVVESAADTAIMDGFTGEEEDSAIPQVQYRLIIRVEKVMEFTSGMHSDQPS